MSYYDDRDSGDRLYQGPDLAQDNPRVVMVRRLRAIIVAVLAILMFPILFFQYQTGMEPFAELEEKPLLPIHDILFGILMIGFLINIVTMIFKAIEIKVSETGSQKFLLANASMKAGISTLVIALIFAILIFIIPTADWAQDIVDSTEKGSVGSSSSLKTSFRSQDEFLITHTMYIRAHVKTGGPINGTVHDKTAYDTGANDSMQVGSDVVDLYPGSNGTVQKYDYPVKGNLDYGEYYLIVHNFGSSDAQVDIIIDREIDTGLVNDLFMFCLLFAIVNGVWAGVAAGIRSKQKGQSIYT